MSVKHAILRSFNAGEYRAMVQLNGSQKAYLEEITVARNISAAEMVNGRGVAVLFFDEHQPKTAVVLAVFS